MSKIIHLQNLMAYNERRAAVHDARGDVARAETCRRAAAHYAAELKAAEA